MTKFKCPKCGSDSFKLSISERQETVQVEPQVRKAVIINILNITCAKCGWNRHFTRPPG